MCVQYINTRRFKREHLHFFLKLIDAIVIDYPPQEVTEDCSLGKKYGKEFGQGSEEEHQFKFPESRSKS